MLMNSISKILVRDATEADIGIIQAIYAHHVLNGLATFEEVPPPVEQMLARRASVLEAGLPYLAAEIEGKRAVQRVIREAQKNKPAA